MSAPWTVSPKLVSFLAGLLAESDVASTLSAYYPSIMWAGVGWMEGPDRVRKPTPAGYKVGLIEKDNLHDFKIALPNTRFGYIIFAPRPEDERSSRRLIDFDGKVIVVR